MKTWPIMTERFNDKTSELCVYKQEHVFIEYHFIIHFDWNVLLNIVIQYALCERVKNEK